MLLQAQRDARHRAAWAVVAGPLELWFVLATLLFWKVHLSLGEGEQHPTLDLTTLLAGPTGGAAGRPGPGHKPEHRCGKTNGVIWWLGSASEC